MNSAPRRRVAAAAALDASAVVVFVVLGRRSHHEDGSWLAGTARVGAPFLIALLAGWLLVRAWRAPFARVTGVIVWLVTVALGMVLRHTWFDRGTAAAFVIVATVTLGVLLLGWRAIAARRSRRLSSRVPAAEATRTPE